MIMKLSLFFVPLLLASVLHSSSISPLQTDLFRLFPTSSSCRTVWCLLWRLRTPSSCTTRSRRFLSAWCPTSTTTRSAISHGKLGLSLFVYWLSCIAKRLFQQLKGRYFQLSGKPWLIFFTLTKDILLFRRYFCNSTSNILYSCINILHIIFLPLFFMNVPLCRKMMSLFLISPTKL